MSEEDRKRTEAEHADDMRIQYDERTDADRSALLSDQVVLDRHQQPNPRVLFLGDSITGGYGATDFERSFYRLTVKWLERQGLRPVVSKINEADVGRGVEIADVTPLLPSVADKAPFDLVIVELGSNNGTNDHYDTANLVEDYTLLLSSVLATSPRVQFLCLGPWGSPADTNRVHAGIERACAEAGGKFRTLSGLHSTPGNRYTDQKMPDGTRIDDFHPTDQGYRMIFDRIRTGIRVEG